MFSFKKLLAIAALACTVVAHDGHESGCTAVTVTVTSFVQECATSGLPGLPAPTHPGPSYDPPAPLASSGAALPASSNQAPPPAPPASSLESTATTPLSSGAPPASSDPVAPTSSGAASQLPSASHSAPGTTPVPSSTAAGNRPSSPSNAPATVSTAGAALATPLVGLGVFAAMAVFA